MNEIFRQFVNTHLKPLFDSLLSKERRVGETLLLANILLVFFLILLNNLGVLPIANFGNFVFFLFLLLILALYRPGWTFLFFVGTIAIENISVAPAELGINVRPYQLFAALTIISVIVRYFAKRLNFELPKWKLLDLAPAVFAAASFFSAAFSENAAASLKISAVALSFAAIYYLVRIFVQNADDLKKIIPFFISSSVVIMIYGIWQNVAFARGRESFAAMPGRANATFTEPDWLGIFVVFIIAIIYSMLYFISKSAAPSKDIPISKQITNYKLQITKNFLLASYFSYLVLAYISLILTVSRSAWLGALVVTVLYLLIIFTNLKISPRYWQWKNTLKIKIGILAALLASLLIVYFFNLTSFQLFNRFQSTGTGLQKITISCLSKSNFDRVPEKVGAVDDLVPYSCQHINLEEIEAEKEQGNFIGEVYRDDPNMNIRAEIYRKSWQEIKRHPVLGVGWGNIGDVLGRDGRGTNLNASNIFLELWLGSGLPGLVALASIWVYILIANIKKFFVNSDPGGASLGLFLFLGATSLLVPNLFNAGIFMGILWLFFGIVQIKEDKNEQ